MPRRHPISAAGALAAALLLGAHAPAAGQGQTPSQPPAADDGDQTPSGPLGGMGDVAQPAEPSTTPEQGLTREEEEEAEKPVSVISPERFLLQPSQIHSAFLPEPHDLDPYVPIGIEIGTFILFSEAEIGTILTDNVLDTETDTHSDIAAEVAPSLRLDSNWSRHFFSAQFNADRSWYNDFPIEDDKNYQAVARGRIDVTRRTHLEGEVEASHIQSGANSISLTDVTASAGNPTILQEEHVTAGADHTFNRVTLKVSQTFAKYDYNDDTDPFLVDGILFKNVRDYQEAVTTMRGSYEFQPAVIGFVEGWVDRRAYDTPISFPAVKRDSNGFAVLGGFDLDLPLGLSGEIEIGYGKQDPISKDLSPVDGLLVNGDLIWLPTPMTKVEFLARSEIAETTLTDSLGAIDRFYELSLQHAFWRYLVLGAYASYERADFVDDPQVDQRFKEGLTAEYYFNQYMSVYGRYEHTNFISTQEDSNFVENEVRLGFRIRH